MKITRFTSSLHIMQFETLLPFARLRHLITMRGDADCDNPYSSLNLCDYTGDDLQHVKQSRNEVAAILGIDADHFVFPRQVHGDAIGHVKDNTFCGEFDAVVTDKPNLFIGVSTADCVPILLYCPEKQVIAAVHAGWRGTVRHIASQTVAFMVNKYGCNAEAIWAGIGPSISPEAFEVGMEVAREFEANGFGSVIIPSPLEGKAHIDLWEANRLDLAAAGILPCHIEIAGICTFRQHSCLFSARRLGIRSGRIISGIMLTHK